MASVPNAYAATVNARGFQPMVLTVIIPALNEEETIASVVEKTRNILQNLGFSDFEILVVDDGSKDRTAERATRAGARVIRGSTKGGYGAALKRGFAAARGELTLILDADGTYPPEAIGLLLQELEAGADQVIAERPLFGAASPGLRWIVKRGIHRVASYCAGVEVRDLNSGMRLLRTARLRALSPLLPSGFSLTTSLTMADLLTEGRVCWVPIPYAPRSHGSKFRPVRDTLRLLAALVRSFVYFAPLRLFAPVASLVGAAGIGFALWDVVMEHNLGDKTVLALLTALELFMIGLLADFVVRQRR
jgi:glycosyltransferase involved in cell wall biosynthesis